jgi:hypothetical protein
MSRAACTFRQRDLTAAVKGVIAAGVAVARVEVYKSGKIVVIPAGPNDTAEENGAKNEWDSIS